MTRWLRLLFHLFSKHFDCSIRIKTWSTSNVQFDGDLDAVTINRLQPSHFIIIYKRSLNYHLISAEKLVVLHIVFGARKLRSRSISRGTLTTLEGGRSCWCCRRARTRPFFLHRSYHYYARPVCGTVHSQVYSSYLGINIFVNIWTTKLNDTSSPRVFNQFYLCFMVGCSRQLLLYQHAHLTTDHNKILNIEIHHFVTIFML